MRKIDTAKVRLALTAIETAQEDADLARAHEAKLSAEVMAAIADQKLGWLASKRAREQEASRTATVLRLIEAQEVREVGAARTEAIKALLLVGEPKPRRPPSPRPRLHLVSGLDPRLSYYMHGGL